MDNGVEITDTPYARTLEEALKEVKNKVVRVGWFDKAIYPNGTQVAYVVVIQENGVPEKNIPARPFMVPTYNEHRDEWLKILEEGAEGILDGDVNARDVLAALGELAGKEIQRTITEITDPPLSPVTIQRRLDKKEIDLTADGADIQIIRDEKGKAVEYLLDGVSIGLLAKPLEDTGYMYATCTFEVGKN